MQKEKQPIFHYWYAVDLLKRNDKQSTRDAYYDPEKVKKIYNDYLDIDAKMSEALYKDTTHVLFKWKNQTRSVLSTILKRNC